MANSQTRPRNNGTKTNGVRTDGRTNGGTDTVNENDAAAETTPVRTGARTLPETFMDERDDVLGVINELEDQLDRYEEIRSSLERELNETTTQLQTTRQRAQELEWQAVTLQTRVDAHEQVRQEIAVLEEEIADANVRNQRLSEQLSQSEKDVARITAELKAANKQLEELWVVRKERDGLRVDAKNLRARVETTERTIRELNEERNVLSAKVEDATGLLEETRSARHQGEMDLRAAEDRNEELRRVQDALEQKIDALKDERKAFQAKIAHLERENARLVEQQQFFECELTSLRSANRTAESALANVKKAFAEVRIALAETKSRARRRTLENWPRVAGISDPSADGDNDEGMNGEFDDETCDTATGRSSPVATGAGTTD